MILFTMAFTDFNTSSVLRSQYKSY